MKANLMANVSDHGTFFWERFQGMAGDEPSSLNIVFL
jgi:hypothetical protein